MIHITVQNFLQLKQFYNWKKNAKELKIHYEEMKNILQEDNEKITKILKKVYK